LGGNTWFSLVSGGTPDTCLLQAGALNKLNQGTSTSSGGNGGPATGPSGSGKLTFQKGIDAQVPTESAALATLISCISSQITKNATINSISDSDITSGKKTIEQCAAAGCSHTANSCHYGGRNCIGESFAVDLGGDLNDLTTAAKACGASTNNEGSHLHVSVGAQNNCGCDNGLD
jgi:hypothetical protein